MRAHERFLKYITFDTQSDENSGSCPSTAKQKVLGEYLANEMREMGLSGVSMDENGYVYGTVPASAGSEEAPVMAYIAHMDPSPAASGKDVKAVIAHEVTADGERDVIRSDGTTLLGADDKAGIAEILTAAEILLKDPDAVHPEIRVVFTPDEEIGRGTNLIDMDKVSASYAYTVDGGEVGELTYECFNASSARIVIRGESYHPGDSYGKMKNAILIAQEFIAMLPADETPATTRGREGFYHLDEIRGDVSCCVLNYILRDHDRNILRKREETVRSAADSLNEKYGGVEAEITESYANMIEAIMPKYAFLLDRVREVYREMGIVPDEEPIRGGTDGARLSFLGLPCPNLGTGGHDFHGPHEYITIQSMDKATEVLVRLAAKFAAEDRQ